MLFFRIVVWFSRVVYVKKNLHFRFDRKSAVCCLRPAIFKHKKVSFDQNPELPHLELQDEICFVPCIQQLGVEPPLTHPEKKIFLKFNGKFPLCTCF